MDAALRAAVRDYLTAIDEYEAAKHAANFNIGRNARGNVQTSPHVTYAADAVRTARDRMRDAMNAAPAAERKAA